MAADLSRARIALVGAGRVGTTFALAFLSPHSRPRFQGELRLWSRTRKTLSRARALVWRAPLARVTVRFVHSLAEAVKEADVVILCVADAALESTAREVGRVLGAQGNRRAVVLCANGFQDLARIRSRLGGVRVGRLHPLHPVLLPPPPRPFFMVPFGIEGDAKAIRTGRELVRPWQGLVLVLNGRRESAAAYHAGAALLGGGIVALYALAEQTMAPALRSRDSLRDALAKFACANAVDAWLVGARQALTGPLARGSEVVVRGHLRALARVPRASAAYRALGEVMLDLARERNTIDAAAERRLRRLLRATKR